MQKHIHTHVYTANICIYNIQISDTIVYMLRLETNMYYKKKTKNLWKGKTKPLIHKFQIHSDWD